jgi:tetratricopeptide (TPR) repeat protein
MPPGGGNPKSQTLNPKGNESVRLTLGHIVSAGQALFERGQPKLAVDFFEAAADSSPGDPNILTGYASAMRAAGMAGRAQLTIKQALAIEPSAKRHTVSGCTYRDLELHDLAEASFRDALALEPQFVDALGLLAETLLLKWHRALGEDAWLVEALNLIHVAIELQPGNADFRATRLSVLQAIGASRAVIDAAELDIATGLECHEFHIHRAVGNLRLGNLSLGYREFADALASRERFASNPILSFPQWRRSTKPGEVLIWNPEGAGDLYQQARWFRVMRDEGWTVRVVANETMSRLMALCPGVASVHDPEEDLHPEYQATPIWLPAEYLGTEADIPTRPFLGPDSETAEHWQRALALLSPPPRLRVGVLWRGNERQGNNARRSFELADLAPVFEVPGVDFINLQKGHAANRDKRGRNWLDTVGAVQLGADYQAGDWLDTAGVLAQLDLVITPDTGVAHLAGGMGVPAWVALSEPGCWRWQSGRDDSPWYPSMRLFRQAERGSWAGVFERMTERLSQFALSGAA